MPAPKNPIQMAVIGAAHGIKGEVRVKTFTGDPLALGDYGPLYTADGRAFEVADIRPANTVVVVRFKGVKDRDAAEALAGTELFVDRSALPDEEDDDEFYHADLIGLAIQDDSGAAIGTVQAIHNFGADDILEVALSGRKTMLIPFSRAAVPEISVQGGFVRIDPVAAGLTDEDDDAETGVDRRPRGPKDAGGNR
ncbi:MAG: ribosome maturation factor RimM [Mesorhizobium sp.]